jgi:hypothetical protein
MFKQLTEKQLLHHRSDIAERRLTEVGLGAFSKVGLSLIRFEWQDKSWLSYLQPEVEPSTTFPSMMAPSLKAAPARMTPDDRDGSTVPIPPAAEALQRWHFERYTSHIFVNG